MRETTRLAVAVLFLSINLLTACGRINSLNCEGNAGELQKMTQDGHSAHEEEIIHFIQENKIDTSGCTEHDPLIAWAVRHGHLKLTKLLLDRGEDINTSDRSGTNLLNLSALRGHQPLVRLILEKGADVNKVSNKHTAIFWAARAGNVAVVKILLDNGADVSIRSGFSETPLIQSVVGGKIGILKMLLEQNVEKNAEINTQNMFGKTPLMFTGIHNREAMAKLLLERGADPDIQDNEGETALMIATKKGHTKVVEVLLSGKARVDIEDGDGKTALMHAYDNNHKDLIKILKKQENASREKKEMPDTIPFAEEVHMKTPTRSTPIFRNLTRILKKNKNKKKPATTNKGY